MHSGPSETGVDGQASFVIAVPRERTPGERRVAATPETCRKLASLGARVRVEQGAGGAAAFTDEAYAAAGAEVVQDQDVLLTQARVVLCVRPPEADAIARLPRGAVLVGQLAPGQAPARDAALVAGGITGFALERLPRTTRAQSMDVLSSQAGMAGYKAMLIAATLVPRFFPMLTTAAGTIRPSRVLVIGAGVAGLQAIATARRLGAQVEGFDVRPETREQVESLGARFLDLGITAVGEGGYARPLTDEERASQQARLGEHLQSVDVLVTTAAVPGRPAPRIIDRDMASRMRPGSVIVDLAAETGGNCELTVPGETVDVAGVTIAGPLDLASRGAVHASEMYARNVANFVALLVREGQLALDWSDELLAATAWPERPASDA